METFSTRFSDAAPKILSRISSLSAFNTVIACTAVWALIKFICMSRTARLIRTPRLMGPPSSSFLYGTRKQVIEAKNPASVYESWARKYGVVYEVPSAFGGRKIVLHDPKAIAHFHAGQASTYARTPAKKKAYEQLFGRGLLSAEGESHKRQRKSLAPAFSIAAVRELTPIFYDSAHKAKTAWNTLIESSGGDAAIIDVQNWMNYISLDSIGLAGFSHDFGAFEGKYAPVTEIFDAFSSSAAAAVLNIGFELLSEVFPFLIRVPTPRRRLIWRFNGAMEDISNTLLARTKQELDMGVADDKMEKSIIGLLIKGAGAKSEFHLTKEEVLAQMKALFLAGYETTAYTMTWALIELSRNPDVQTKLRNELLGHASDPTYDQLANGLHYLDVVIHENLRIHPPAREMLRQAMEDDVVPLSQPVRMKSGQLVEKLPVAKGTIIEVPTVSIHCSTDIFGEDAKEFKPSRWVEDEHGHNGIQAKAKEIQGHRHLLSFSEGPRVCIGKNYAITELKAVLFVLVRNFVFELRDGPQTKIEISRGFISVGPRVAGEEGSKVPLRVKPYMG